MIINTVDPASGVQADFGQFATGQVEFLTNSFLNRVSGYLYINGVLQTEITMKKPFRLSFWDKVKSILNYKLI